MRLRSPAKLALSAIATLVLSGCYDAGGYAKGGRDSADTVSLLAVGSWQDFPVTRPVLAALPRSSNAGGDLIDAAGPVVFAPDGAIATPAIFSLNDERDTDVFYEPLNWLQAHSVARSSSKRVSF